MYLFNLNKDRNLIFTQLLDVQPKQSVSQH